MASAQKRAARKLPREPWVAYYATKVTILKTTGLDASSLIIAQYLMFGAQFTGSEASPKIKRLHTQICIV
ncbi:MAG: hypothetical protein EBW38_08010 [Rhodobacteraceae bacterium]|nr:hypothetical protein [Paracoccaceae bacterium]